MQENSRLIAIADLGTNTFNLLVAEVNEDGQWRSIFRNSLPVKLAQGGIDRRTIAKDRFYRGVDAMLVHAQAIKNFDCNEVYAYATAAVREAHNGVEFVDAIKEKTGISVVIIDGLVEAELIHRGVIQTIHDSSQTNLIMDIGGGSTEFILSRNKEILWKESFPLGVSRIKEVLDPPDPLGSEGERQLRHLLSDSLGVLWQNCKGKDIKALYGASGSFNTMAAILERRSQLIHAEDHLAAEIGLSHFRSLKKELLSKNYEQRIAIKGMHPMRADTLHISAYFVNYILEELQIQRLFQSTYALKEGALDRLLNK